MQALMTREIDHLTTPKMLAPQSRLADLGNTVIPVSSCATERPIVDQKNSVRKFSLYQWRGDAVEKIKFDPPPPLSLREVLPVTDYIGRLYPKKE